VMLKEWFSLEVGWHEEVAVGIFEGLFMVFIVASVGGQNCGFAGYAWLIVAESF
jgi:hypothetical protein